MCRQAPSLCRVGNAPSTTAGCFGCRLTGHPKGTGLGSSICLAPCHASCKGDPKPHLGPPAERLVLSVVYVSRGTLPQKRGEKGHLAGEPRQQGGKEGLHQTHFPSCSLACFAKESSRESAASSDYVVLQSHAGTKQTDPCSESPLDPWENIARGYPSKS